MLHTTQLFFTALLFSISVMVHATNIGGVLTQNTTLSPSGNPYYVTSDLQVMNGVTLTILPGTTLYFYEGTYLKVAGTLDARGTASNRITFTKDPFATGWHGVRFFDNSTDFDTSLQTGSIIEHALIERTVEEPGVSDQYAVNEIYTIKCAYAKPMLRDLEIRYASAGFCFLAGGYLYNSYVHDGAAFIDHFYGWGGPYDTLFLVNNHFKNVRYMDQYDGPMITTGLSVIQNNIFENCPSASFFLRVSEYSVITGNIFRNNPNIMAIGLWGGDGHIIRDNVFDNNSINIRMVCDRHPVVKNNCFVGYNLYNIYISNNPWETIYLYYDCYNQPVDTMDFTGNYFGTLDSATIANSIYDAHDNVAESYVAEFLPVITTCVIPSYNSLAAEEPEAVPDLIVSPNPATGMVQVLSAGTPENVVLYAMNGSVVGRYGNVSSFDVSALAPGVYLLSAELNGNPFYTRLVKQ